jgi:ATP-dependent Clp protease ATP-binding subunit ClpA
MFEHYTENARRVLFFARYEAGVLGSHYVEPGHLLLALIREDKAICSRFIGPQHEIVSIREQIENAAHHGESASTTVDIPLNQASKWVLAQAEMERESLGMPTLGTQHILLGLLQEESPAADIWRERGVKIESVREQMEKPVTSVPTTRPKTTCRDCRYLIIDGEPDSRLNLVCAAAPIKTAFDCYTGTFRDVSADRPRDLFRPCIVVNFGDCRLFRPKPESPELPLRT